MTFQEKLKKFMLETDYSIGELARLCRTAPGTVSRWLNGHSAPAKAAQEAILKMKKEKDK